ncbi:MAG: hypothetical protein D3906_15320 [Candidatus Electrothrix sp. AUS1_2]|nr:hypothetical protein [Candidatus Electrothrix sp. AUS1_2]
MGEDYSVVMNFSIPDHKAIRKAFAEGEEAVFALFGEVTAQVEELARQSFQNKQLVYNYAMDHTTAPNRTRRYAGIY